MPHTYCVRAIRRVARYAGAVLLASASLAHAAQFNATNASADVLVNARDAAAYLTADNKDALPALEAGKVSVNDVHENWPPEGWPYTLTYAYQNAGGLILVSGVIVSRDAKQARAVFRQTATDLRGDAIKQALALAPLEGLKGWQEDVTAWSAAQGERQTHPSGVVAVMRRGVNVAYVIVLGPAAPKNAAAFKAFLDHKADRMLSFKPELPVR
ncbi:hypothetical protein [Bordetella genomosp. 5]|uniref:Uncharacterized protein n=1 Tax=Bordetella genomosp. 5 TaxID=1395608 RepID=A0A261TH46_9BORD|nr:hypothetical protein [Bordetella genomosp. 5]OZI47953.1 hypothetical protein CAL25_16305 [Bordetella genomosp. 5]